MTYQEQCCKEYDMTHKISKAIVCVIVITLLAINRTYHSFCIDAAVVVVWIFGVNFIGRVLEYVSGCIKQHPWI